MRKVEFIKEFATKKKGAIMNVDSSLANTLVRDLKVAKFVKDKK